MHKLINFNKTYISGNELEYIYRAVKSGKLSGNGEFTKLCHKYFEEKFDFRKVLLTTSCTDALEMCAMLCRISPGDEVIVPSYTFVSTALAFARQGANIIFWDSREDHPGVDEDLLESLITQRTKVIVPVHYAGVSCNMDIIMKVSKKYNLIVVEDAAQAIDSYYNGQPLGGIGHLSAFSFHDTKNIIAGEGGLLVINDSKFLSRAEIIWEKGTDRAKYFRGEVDKYTWVDTGSSFLASEITAAFLYGQLENLERIQKRRVQIWDKYYNALKSLQMDGFLKLPFIPKYATNNGHMFYVICNSANDRTALMKKLKKCNVLAVFHYSSLHLSPFGKNYASGDKLIQNSEIYANRLLRLPLYYEMKDCDIDRVTNCLFQHYRN